MSRPSGVRGLAHVLVLSDDLARSRDFYERVLGLEVGARPPLPFAGHWLYADGECCLHLAERRLRDCGVSAVAHDVPDGGPRQLFLEDPDGLRVELSIPAGH